MTRTSGTFVQETPEPGRSWHITTDEKTTLCGSRIVIGRAEFLTTGEMPEFKVCAACWDRNDPVVQARRAAATEAFKARYNAILAAR